MVDEIANWTYQEITQTRNIPTIEMLVKVFIETAQKCKVANIYRSSMTFAFYHGGIMYETPRNGFSSLVENVCGVEKGFDNASTYHDAEARGYVSASNYNRGCKNGYETQEDLLNAEKLGFDGVWNKHFSKIFTDYEKRNIKQQNDAFIYYMAKERGYADCQEFVEGHGYENVDLFREVKAAMTRGFKSKDDYLDAKKSGFVEASEYYSAKELNIKIKQNYDLYISLKQIKESIGYDSIHEAHLYYYISGMPRNKKLWDEFHEVSNIFLIEEPVKHSFYDRKNIMMPEWYKVTIRAEPDLKLKVATDSKLHELGIYDGEVEVFERKHVSRDVNRSVLVDGSNVAWAGSKRNNGDKPHAVNIVDYLTELGHKDILAISDAALRHQIVDKDVYDRLLKDGKIQEAPAKTDADSFIINYAKEKSAVIITNDTFRDWKEKDAWVKNNIDKIRRPFMIIDGKITLDESLENRPV
jgi:hypothetical protein